MWEKKVYTRMIGWIGVTTLLAVTPQLWAGLPVLESFEGYSDGQVIGNSFDNLNPANTAPAAPNTMASFGAPFNNVNDITATATSPLAGNVSGQFIAEWGQATAGPYVAGALLDFVAKNGSTRNLRLFTGMSILLSSSITSAGNTPGVSGLQLVVSDSTYSYASDMVALGAVNNEYSFLFSDPFGISDRSGLAPMPNEPTFLDVLGNAQRVGFSLVRSGFSNDVETVSFDNLTLIPEPASVVLLMVGMGTVLTSRRRRGVA